MLWNRIRGLWNAYHAILAVVLTVLYWVFLTGVSPIIQGWSIAYYPPFILYNVAAVVGLIIAAIRNRSDAATLLAGGLSIITSWLSSRQFISVWCCFLR